MSDVFPPPFEATAPDGRTVLVDDVDVLLELAAEEAGVPLRRLDRRQLEAALSDLSVPPLHAERAVMVFVGRKRQERLANVRRGVGRGRAFVLIVLVALATVVYGVRLERRLEAKLERARAAEVVYRRVRADARAAAARLDASGLDSAERARLEESLASIEDRVAAARRRYDRAANDYDTTTRGFPTTPFAHLVGMPERVPMSWELARDR